MKLIVAGSRTFTDYQFVEYVLDAILPENKTGIEIVSGGANGVDKLGEKYAFEHNLKCIRFSADWTTHGKAAGPIRNALMADYADTLVAFWDGESRGTKNMIDLAKKKGLVIHEVKI